MNSESIQPGGPNHDRIGFRYWKNPGPSDSIMIFLEAREDFRLVGSHDSSRFLLHWYRNCGCMCDAISSPSVRSQLHLQLQIAAGEAKNPRRNIPRAIRRVYIRLCVFLPNRPHSSYLKGIILFYIGGVIVIGWLVHPIQKA